MFSKERVKGFILGVVVTLAVTSVSFASTGEKTLKAAFRDIKICIDNTLVALVDSDNKPVEPFISGGTTYVPLRAVSKAFNKSVKWDGTTNTIYLNTLPAKEQREAQPGDIVGIQGTYAGYAYEHYGVYIGNGKVIHYHSASGLSADAEIVEADMNTAFPKGQYFVLNFGQSKILSTEETIKNAKSKLGEKKYNLVSNNCEHFAIWCKTGIYKSYQIDALDNSQLTQLNQLANALGISIGI